MMTRRLEFRNGFFWPLATIFIMAVFAAGCAEGGQSEAPEIVGTYTDQFGDTHEITQTKWTILSVNGNSIVRLRAVDNFSNYTVGKNDDTVSFNPGKFSRLDWTFFNDDIFMCTSVFDGFNLDDAFDGEVDATDPTAGGCSKANNFTWTNLTP